MSVIPLFVGCILGFAYTEDGINATMPGKEQVAALVRQLGSQRFQEREAATHALEALGEASLVALQRAAQDKDPEVRRRAALLVHQIQQRAESARILTPWRVQLDYDDVTPSEIIGDLAKKTGAKIRMASRRSEAPGQAPASLSLHTGRVTFWEALDQLCEKAGLIERPSLSTAEVNDLIRRGQMTPQSFEQDIGGLINGTINLEAGTPKHYPTAYSGAVRLRALPLPADMRRGLTDQTGFLLDISPQHNLAWRSLLGVRIDRAIDQDGQSLQQVLTSVPQAVVDSKGFAFDVETGRQTNSLREAAVRLSTGEKPSRTLQEVRGTVVAQVQTQREPLVTVENILQAAKKSFPGKSGEVVTVMECSLDQQAGQVKVRVQLKEDLPQVVGVAPNGRLRVQQGVMRRQLVVRGNANVVREQLLGSADWILIDEEGNSLLLTDSDIRPAVNANGFIQDATLQFRLSVGKPRPTKLVYSGQRLVNIEVPFTLKQVPLP